MNLEGRVQRLRRAVIAPVPDELAWIAKLAARFGVELSPHAAVVFEELSERLYGGLALEQLGEQAPLPAARAVRGARARPRAARRRRRRTRRTGHFLGDAPAAPLPAALLRARRSSGSPSSSSSGPSAEVALSTADADRRGIATGDLVTVRSNGTSVELRARVDRRLVDGRRAHRRRARRRPPRARSRW